MPHPIGTRFLCVLFSNIALCAPADETYDQLRAEAWAESKTEFEEEPALGGDSLSLEALIAAVQARNPSVESARNAWRAALARYPQERALEDPMVSYSVAPGTLDRPDIGMDGNLNVGQRFEVSQAFSWPGKRRLRGRAALEEADAVHLDIAALREELAYEAKQAFHEHWYADRALEINAISQQLLEELETAAEIRYASGNGSKQEALLVSMEREHLDHGKVVLNRMRNTARAQINTLLNRPTDASLPPPPIEAAAPLPTLEVKALELRALENRPELRALARRAEAQDTTIEAERREFYPDFEIMGAYDSMWDHDEQRFMIGAAISVPIQIGRRRAAVEEARANLLQIESDRTTEAANVLLEVREAFEELEERAHAVALYGNRLLPIAEENISTAQSAYEAGESDFSGVIEAQMLLTDTTLSHVEALALYQRGVAALERAVAGPVHESVTLE